MRKGAQGHLVLFIDEVKNPSKSIRMELQKEKGSGRVTYEEMLPFAIKSLPFNIEK